MSVKILSGDCIELMRTLAENSIDAVVTDPPYGIRFMGKAWDGADIEARAQARRDCPSKHADSGPNGGHRSIAAEAGKYDLSPAGMLTFQEFSQDWAREALRVLKPGGHLLAFASARTYHRMVCGIEAAGFEIRDQIMWLFGSGFPKSKNLDGDWEGWGTALKPAHEPIVVARKPLAGTVAGNVELHTTGALNINGCRVPTSDHLGGGAYSENSNRAVSQSMSPTGMNRPGARAAGEFSQPVGRWPANVMHDGSDEVLAALPDAPGQIVDASSSSSRKTQNVYGAMARGSGGAARRDDAGSAARFFYCAKASKADREAGCEGLPTKRGGMVSNTSGQHITRRDGGEPGERANHHPTVKPTDLMRWLVRLVTPPGGTVLDPFMGSGSTGRGAVLEGFGFVGIELDAEYGAIAEARISGAIKHRDDEEAIAEEKAMQSDIFGQVA